MKSVRDVHREYLEVLEARGRGSRVHRPFQLVGLNIATLLRDTRHRALYIKLAKEYNGDLLLSAAKRVAENSRIRNKGAYFMRMITRMTSSGAQRSAP